MRIRLSTSDYNTSKQVLQLLSECSAIGSENDQPQIAWGEVTVRPGAVETMFELVGTVAASVSTGLLANWIWSLIQQHPRMNEVRIEVQKPDGHRIVIEGRSADAIKLQLKGLVDTNVPKPNKPTGE